MFQTVLFDLDGTLVDSRADLVAAVNVAVKAVGKSELTDEQVLKNVGNGMRRLVSESIGPSDETTLQTAIDAFRNYYGDHCVDKTTLYPGVMDVLIGLKGRYRTGVVTNKPFGFSTKILNSLGIGGLIGTVVGGDSLAERKPHPAPVKKALADLNASADSALLVGDGAQDLEAGKAAGLMTCLVAYGYGSDLAGETPAPDFLIEHFLELKEILK